MKLTKEQREQLKQKYGGHCAYCGCTLSDKWHADHFEPIRRNNDGTCLNPELDVFQNLMPACPVCNKNKHSYPLEYWRKTLEDANRKLTKYVANYRLALMFGQVKETTQPVVFYFERYGTPDVIREASNER
ncbi:HNH endonuclease [Acinetobacter larvae]|uniref:HNH endonuclease n=1 Tax=Acinetobacter larvae TaxID=1789224 RepID=A0A1B2LZD3_9GAMM|nr:HNH endonuclease signature motif containing protein [Acinetobacter larvae]AOA58310.1 HNH endonuclease [Acinetobacter larvae]